jgi:hypothetical protein
MVSRVKAAISSRSRMDAGDVWLLVQATAAATLAWVIAHYLVQHREPFFAPVAALVSLNVSLGERGLNALRLLGGVALGIIVAESTLLLLGGGYGSLAFATFLALVIARALGGARIVLNQAAISAILTIAVANGEVGYQRLTDALIGAGVALVFTQLIFSPEPLRLLRRVEANALEGMAIALDLTAQAITGDQTLADRAIDSLRDVRDGLAELARMRRVSARVARHSLVWRGHVAPVVQETEDAGHLDLLGSSCLLLTRMSIGVTTPDQQLARCVRALSETLADLSQQPGDRARRQRAVDRSLQILAETGAASTEPDPRLTAALTAVRMAVIDLLLFVGVDPGDIRAATTEDAREQPQLEAPAPPSARKGRLDPRRWFR